MYKYVQSAKDKISIRPVVSHLPAVRVRSGFSATRRGPGRDDGGTRTARLDSTPRDENNLNRTMTSWSSWTHR